MGSAGIKHAPCLLVLFTALCIQWQAPALRFQSFPVMAAIGHGYSAGPNGKNATESEVAIIITSAGYLPLVVEVTGRNLKRELAFELLAVRDNLRDLVWQVDNPIVRSSPRKIAMPPSIEGSAAKIVG